MVTIPNISGTRLESLCEFLSAAGLTYEGGAEYTVLLLDDETDAAPPHFDGLAQIKHLGDSWIARGRSHAGKRSLGGDFRIEVSGI